MQNKKIYIILLNYNGWQDTIECLESVLHSDYENYQIIVVDNASPNNSMDYILNWANGEQAVIYDKESKLKELSRRTSKPINYIFYNENELNKEIIQNKEKSINDNPIIFIQSSKNEGFAAGNNIGTKYAQIKNDYKYIWLLNNDTVIRNDTLTNLINYADTNQVGICGSTLMYYYYPTQVQAYGGHINKFLGTGSHIVNKENIEKELDYIVGASFLINKDVIDKIGLMPEDYFLYYEETDYCFNARNNGFKLGVALDSIVYHKEGGSTGVNADPGEKSEFSDVLIMKNRIKFHKKYLGGGFFLWIGLSLVFLNRIRRGQFSRIKKVLYK